ncbi:interferon alpha/beta receptor 1 isoform X2 [Cavia porcellus]|nr:interferon alpha/beta receptor 1 isoform X2 [Cavia porcellus]
MDNWIKLPGCQHITGSKCDFFPLINFYEEIKFRVRAEEENSTSSWYYVDPFIPFQKARLGPPEVRLEAEDKAVIIYLFRPGKRDGTSIWDMDALSFEFSLVFWENSSHGEEQEIKTNFYISKMYDLSTETTYCLKAKARLSWKVSAYSPVYCINTTAEHKLLPPENVTFGARNQSYVLTWEYRDVNVTFRAQWLHAFSKLTPWDNSNEWKQIPNCENVRTTYCVFPQSVFQKKEYYFRVQASDGNDTSFWSKEKAVQTEMYSTILPPVVSMKSTNDSLHVFVKAPKKQFDTFTYEIILWENASHTERKLVSKRSDIIIPGLKPLTPYCIKARVLLQDKWNKTSVFSAVVCEKTKPGAAASIPWVIPVIVILLLAVIAFCVMKLLWKCFNYVFFPVFKPPCSIEHFSEQPFGNLLLSTSEEQTEKCFIIENTQSVIIVEEPEETDEDYRKYSSQSSQDSGNYSNEDESLGNQISEALLQLKPQALSCPGELVLGLSSLGLHSS